MPLPPPRFPFGAARAAGVAEAAARRAVTGRALESAFRLPTGEVVRSGAFHDLNVLPPGLWDEPRLEAGFVDAAGKFMTRQEALAAHEPAGAGHSTPWLRARAEALRAHARGVPRTYDTLVREAEQGGGFTYDVKSGARPRRGFAFSASPEDEAVLGELTPEAVAEYVRAHEGPLGGADAFLGAWRSPEGRWHLDVSRVLPDREAALREARGAGQRAVYDLATGETLEVKP